MFPYLIPVWKKASFIRVVLAWITGIWLQDTLQVGFTTIFSISLLIFFCYSRFYALPIYKRFRYRHVHGGFLLSGVMCFAMLVTWNKDIRHQNSWYGHHVQSNDGFMIRIETPPTQKGKYWQAVGAIQALFHQQKWMQTTGNVNLLVPVDSQQRALQYGDVLFVRGKLQLISQATNPGGFNYRVYMARQQIFHSIRVTPTQYRRIAEHQGSWMSAFVFQARTMVLDRLDRFIQSGPSIKGIAEALLIGYKENLDGKLIQSYSNTGLVHIIAISGLHLGVIYIILLFLLEKIPFVN